MDRHHQRWEAYYQAGHGQAHDDWLVQYDIYFASETYVLDLGCGNGSNIDYVLTKTRHVYACDYAQSAIEYVAQAYAIVTAIVDIRGALPYADSFFDIIIADLSLHYFREDETVRILKELVRITKKGGHLLVRVNSTNDRNYGAGQGNELERYYYEQNGIKKRFFDRDMVDAIFGRHFAIQQAEEKRIGKYGTEKVVWEILLKNETLTG